MPRLPAVLALILAAFTAAPALHAGTQVRILETWPSGDDVVLGRNQKFYLRIAYSTDTPTRIWARPLLRGEAARAGSNPSAALDGEGETIGWFFLMTPDDEADEVRIRVGDGSPRGTTDALAWHGHVRGSNAIAAEAEPAWVGRLLAQAQAAAEQARAAQEAARTPADDAADARLFAGFMLAVAVLGLGGLATTAWAVARWRGGWRIAAAIPAVGLAFVVLRILIDGARDPTSHNLWPFEIVFAGGLALLAIGALAVVRRFARR